MTSDGLDDDRVSKIQSNADFRIISDASYIISN